MDTRGAREYAAGRQTTPRCFLLTEHLSGCEDPETWPDSLRRFPWDLPRADATFPEYQTIENIAKVCKALRKYYPDDEVLMRYANFVESEAQSNPSVMFSVKYTLS